MDIKLTQFGWNEASASLWSTLSVDEFMPGRVIADFGTNYKVALPNEITADLSGKLQHTLEISDMPKVGDWVAVQLLDEAHGTIQAVMPRMSEIIRKRAGKKYEKQVLAANVDIAFLVQALDNDFSPERLRRYAFQLQKAAIRTIIVLNKSDIVDDLPGKLQELESFDFEIIVASAANNKGIDAIAGSIKPGMTAVFLGSSGVGKSTITNLLLGKQQQRTKAVRKEDSTGQHATTHRELFVLPKGGLIIDTPGLRELQLWGTERDLDNMYPEISDLVHRCKFSNCSHDHETDCAVKEALKTGKLALATFESYLTFKQELRALNLKVDANAKVTHKKDHKNRQQNYRQAAKMDKKQLSDDLQ